MYICIHIHIFPIGFSLNPGSLQDMAGYASEVAGKAVNKMKNFALQRHLRDKLLHLLVVLRAMPWSSYMGWVVSRRDVNPLGIYGKPHVFRLQIDARMLGGPAGLQMQNGRLVKNTLQTGTRKTALNF